MRLTHNRGPAPVIAGPQLGEGAVRIPAGQMVYVPAEWLFWTEGGGRATIQISLDEAEDQG